ncbi:hypothetical protein [Streptosporangium sp. NPDC087985]|uniref:hypothetical protein n=1 Tax=Streptosporangium sp. NPDC087985 TaxID=3366196 RepID=UPI0037FFCCE2
MRRQVHVHPRDEAGSESLSAAHIGAAVPGPRLLHGEEGPAWILVDEAGRLGLATRTGLEDVLHSPAGDPVDGNADLVRLALARRV